MSAYIAFPTSSTLREDSLALIDHLESGSKAPQNAIINRVVANMTEELLKAFLVDTVDALKLQPVFAKLVHATVATISTTVQGLSKTVINKMDNEQMQPMVAHVKTLMLNTQADGQVQPWMGFAISAEQHQKMQTVFAGLRSDNPKAHVQDFVAVLSQIADQAIDVYLEQSMELLKLGFILRKLTDGGTGVIKSAMHTLIRKTVPDLSIEQLIAAAAHLESLQPQNASTLAA